MIVILLSFLQDISAAPAYPYPLQITQPDGSLVTIKMHGDEFFGYQTTIDGKTIYRKTDGYFYYATYGYNGLEVSDIKVGQSAGGIITKSYGGMDPQVAKYLRSQSPMLSMQTKSVESKNTLQSTRGLIIIVQYKDVNFKTSSPQATFNRLANEEGYSDNGATGSVRDYFRENSLGKYNPQYDVVGPVMLSNTRSYYGANKDNKAGGDIRPREMIVDACKGAKEQFGTNFSIYDSNNDNVVDMVFVVFAGHNEAQGAAPESIWPHAWELGSLSIYIDGKKINSYACSSELQLAQGTIISGIGTICHEFAHTLGLKDLYDTNGEEEGVTLSGVKNISLMHAGNYNNSERTPPYLNALERYMCGWLTPKTMPTLGSVALQPIQKNEAYLVKGAVDGDYFMFEARNGKGYDQYMNENGNLNVGMMIYHVDISKEHMINGMTAFDRWTYNKPNGDKSHPCFVTLPANSIVQDGSSPAAFYPGTANINSISNIIDWNGNNVGLIINDIKTDGDNVVFNVVNKENYTDFSGVVIDASGISVNNATIILTPYNKTRSVQPIYRTLYRANQTDQIVATTDLYGQFAFSNVEKGKYSISIASYGYEPYVGEVDVTANLTKTYTLNKVTQSLQKRITHADMNTGYYTLAKGYTAFQTFTPEHLSQKGAVGKIMNAVYFYTQSSGAKAEITILADDVTLFQWNVTTSSGLNVSAIPSQFIMPADKKIQISVQTNATTLNTDDGPAVDGFGNVISYNGKLEKFEQNICIGFWTDKEAGELETPILSIAAVQQRSLRINIYSQDANVDKWIIQTTANGHTRTVQTTGFAERVRIDSLEPNTKYIIEVIAVSADKQNKTSIEKQTLPLTAPYPAIVLPNDIVINMAFYPELTNLPQMPKSVVWRLNNSVIDINTYKLKVQGESTLTAEITWLNNKKEMIVKKFKTT